MAVTYSVIYGGYSGSGSSAVAACDNLGANFGVVAMTSGQAVLTDETHCVLAATHASGYWGGPVAITSSGSADPPADPASSPASAPAISCTASAPCYMSIVSEAGGVSGAAAVGGYVGLLLLAWATGFVLGTKIRWIRQALAAM